MNKIEIPQSQEYYRKKLKYRYLFQKSALGSTVKEDFISESQKRKEKLKQRVSERRKRSRYTGTSSIVLGRGQGHSESQKGKVEETSLIWCL